jgi:hypothetical protein
MSLTLTTNVLQKYPRDAFFETGTHHGGGVAVALTAGFRKIYTCDRDAGNVERARDRFPPKKVEVFHGESPKVLAEVLPRILGRDHGAGRKALPRIRTGSKVQPRSKPGNRAQSRIDTTITFWLDAHDDSPANEPTPLLEELTAIFRVLGGIGRHAILIDDMRMLGLPGRWGERLSFDRLKAHIRRLDPCVTFAFEDNAIARQDILVVQGSEKPRRTLRSKIASASDGHRRASVKVRRAK